jgi:hypothetical protein
MSSLLEQVNLNDRPTARCAVECRASWSFPSVASPRCTTITTVLFIKGNLCIAVHEVVRRVVESTPLHTLIVLDYERTAGVVHLEFKMLA